MVMEASPSPQSVGREFVRQYYTLLNKAPSHLHRFYNNHSSFVHGGLDAPNRETLPVVGQKQIHNRIQQLNFCDCHAKISQVDAQATLGNGVVVQVTGELSNGGAPMRRFTQTFVLAAQSPKKYYVHNDIFRYQDIVFSDEEGSGSGRSEVDEEEACGAGGVGGAGGYFPPPPGAFPPGAFPAPPAPPHAALVSPPPAAAPAAGPAPAAAPPAAPALPPAAAPAPAPAPAPLPHLNGHPPAAHHEDATRHLVAALQVERELEPEPALAPPAAAPAPVASLEGGAAPPAPGPVPAPAAEPAHPAPAPAEPEPESEREPAPAELPQPGAAVTAAAPPAPAPAPSNEPKTYANLLKSGGAAGPAPRPAPPAPAAPAAAAAPPSAAPPAAAPPLEQRARPQRPPRDSQPQTEGRGAGGGGGGGGAGRYPDSQQLFLGNLPHSATEEELRALFARFGPVAELRVHSKPAAPGAPRHPNYGFITYESAQAAHDCLNAAPLYFPADAADGVKLNVEEKKTRGREPPRRRPLSSHRAAFQPRPAFRR